MTDRFDEAARGHIGLPLMPELAGEYRIAYRRLAVLLRTTHNAALDAAATALKANHLVSGSNGPLMDMGWNAANKAGAGLILAQKVET